MTRKLFTGLNTWMTSLISFDALDLGWPVY